MGFGNGYDSGYSDAIDDVRNGKMAGLGPASGGGGAAPAPTYVTNAADRYATVTEGSARVRYAAPESVTAAMNGTVFDLQVPTGVPAGTVMNVNLAFEYKEPGTDSDWAEDAGIGVGVSTITVNGTAPSGMQTYEMESAVGLEILVLWYDGASWVCVADKGMFYEE